MKLFILLFATGSLAIQLGTPVFNSPTLVGRDGASITSAIASILTAVGNLQTAVDGFSGAGNVSSLQAASASLLSTIQSATSSVAASADLTSNETLPLVAPVQSLSGLVSSLVDAVVSKKSAFVAVGIGPFVLQTLNALLNASQEFSSAIVSKVPESLQATAQGLGQPIFDALNNGISAYSDQAGAASTSMGGSSASAGSPTSPASNSASASLSAAATSTSQAAAASYVPGGGYDVAVLAAAIMAVAF